MISADGKSSTKVTKDGWIFTGNKYYYVLGGKLCRSETVQIGDKYYAFCEDGTMLENDLLTYAYYYEDALNGFTYNCCRAKADGSLYVNEWYKDKDGDWYYFGENGEGARDFVKINGVWYFFLEGRMVTDAIVYSNRYQACYIISADGTSSTKVTKKGWISLGDNYYYFNDDNMYDMNDIVYYNCIVGIGGKHYAFDSNGAMVTGWLQLGNNWYYFKGNGEMATGSCVIGTRTYQFGSNGVWIP